MEDARGVGRDVTIGLAVASLRGAAGLSQQQVADRMRELGWRWVQPTIWSIEQGRRPVRLAEAVDLATVLGVQLHDLLRPRETSPIGSLVDDLSAQVAALRRSISEAGAHLSDVLTRRDALVDLEQARVGQALLWPAPEQHLWVALGWLDSERVQAVLEHLGVEHEDARALARAHEDAYDADTAADFAAAAWEVLRQVLPAGDPSS